MAIQEESTPVRQQTYEEIYGQEIETDPEENFKMCLDYIRTACHQELSTMKAIGRDGHLNGIMGMLPSMEEDFRLMTVKVAKLQEQVRDLMTSGRESILEDNAKISELEAQVRDLKRQAQRKEDYLAGILT